MTITVKVTPAQARIATELGASLAGKNATWESEDAARDAAATAAAEHGTVGGALAGKLNAVLPRPARVTKPKVDYTELVTIAVVKDAEFGEVTPTRPFAVLRPGARTARFGTLESAMEAALEWVGAGTYAEVTVLDPSTKVAKRVTPKAA